MNLVSGQIIHPACKSSLCEGANVLDIDACYDGMDAFVAFIYCEKLLGGNPKIKGYNWYKNLTMNKKATALATQISRHC